jgi:hypothetical protein
LLFHPVLFVPHPSESPQMESPVITYSNLRQIASTILPQCIRITILLNLTQNTDNVSDRCLK